MIVQLVDAGDTDRCVVVNGKVVLVDNSNGCNRQWYARRVAEEISKALGAKLQQMDWTPANDAWTIKDLEQDLAALAKQMGTK